MGRIHEFREKFEDIIEEVLEEDLSTIDTCELGEVVDMLKDCLEAEYYHAVVEAMETSDYGKELMPQSVRERMYYNDPSSEMVTFEDVLDKLGELVEHSSKEEVLSMKAKLVSMINKM